MKVFIFLLFVSASVNGYVYINDAALRSKGTTLTDVDASVKIGTPPAAYADLFHDDSVATERLQQLVVMLKRILHVGVDPIPVLDPLKRQVLGPFNVNNRLVRGKITLRNVVITGLKSINVDDLVMRLHYDDQFRVDTNATIPSLTFEGELETDVRIKSIIPLKVKGGINIVISNLKVTGAVGGKPIILNDGKSVMNVDSLHGYGRADSALVTLKFASTAMKIIQGRGLGVKMIYKAGKDEIGEAIGATIIRETNKVLSKVSLQAVQAFLVGKD